MGLEGDALAGERLDAVEKGGVEGRAEGGERMQRGWVRGVVHGEHAGCGGAGLLHGVAGIEHDDVGSAVVQFEC